MKLLAIVLILTFLLISGCEFRTSDTDVGHKEIYTAQEGIGHIDESSPQEPEPQPSIFVQILMSWSVYILYYGFGLVIGFFVYRDARRREKLALNIGPIWWAVLTVFQPPLGVLTYWVIHYSTIGNVSAKGDNDVV